MATVKWSSIVGKPVFSTVATTGSYSDLKNIPATFKPSPHDHNTLYKPINYVPKWEEITDKPQEQSLYDAINGLDFLPLPQKTTEEINEIILPEDKRAIVWDKTLGIEKIWNGKNWK